MPLARVNQARYEIIHNRISNAFANNIRTNVANIPVIIEIPIARPVDQSIVYATHITTLNTVDWLSGDFFTVTWRKQPGKISTPRLVKYIIPQEDGIPWQVLVVLGTIDL